MENTVYFGILYNIYGSFLTERQQMILEAYHFEDLSLSEIGENLGITRQAVSDQLNRGQEKLQSCEDALHIYEKSRKAVTYIDAMEMMIDGADSLAMKEKLEELRMLIEW